MFIFLVNGFAVSSFSIFVSAAKIGANISNILNFQSKFTLWHIKLNGYIWKNGKLKLLLIKRSYLVYCSLEMRRRLMQPKLYYKGFYSAWEETSHNPLKEELQKLFPKCVCYWYSLLRWMFFIPCDILYKFILT